MQFRTTHLRMLRWTVLTVNYLKLIDYVFGFILDPTIILEISSCVLDDFK